MTIRVAIADDHSLVRQGLRRYLDMADGIDVVGEASNGKELLELVDAEQPDIALVDIRMPEMDGLGRPRAPGPASEVGVMSHRLRRPAVRGRGGAGRARGPVLKARDAGI